jgi:endoglucanase
MNMRKMLWIGCMLLPLCVYSQREKAFEINQKLGRGINYGNMFEAPSETAWGNPWQPEYTGLIADLGFSHIRIPIRWEPEARSLLSPPYTIYPSFLSRIQQVVDSALANGLYAIINMHHHESLYADPDAQKERFLAMWEQIAGFFREYPDNLLFEILNEPHDQLDAEKWNVFLADALETIRQTNPERTVVIGTAEWGGLGGLSRLTIPDDPNLILTIHYYNPFHFTHQGASWSEGSEEWLGTQWMDTETERNAVRQDFAPLQEISKKENIPIHIGEFGAYEKADIDSRVRWTTFLARYFESLDWSWAYWEFCAGFGIYNPQTKTYLQPLVNALLYNEIGDAFEYETNPVYRSDFCSGTDSWSLFTQGTASAQMQTGNAELIVSITRGGDETWHVQLVRRNIALDEEKKYRVSFTARASEPTTLTAYTGITSSPWSAYSDYNHIPLSDSLKEYAYIFESKATDPDARIVFDMGISHGNVIFSEIKMDEIFISTAPLVDYKKPVSVFPNPVRHSFRLTTPGRFKDLELFNMNGIPVGSRKVELNKVYDISGLSPGIYVVRLSDCSEIQTCKILKL